MDVVDNPLEQGVVYQASLPVAWRPLTEPPSEDRLLSLNESNCKLLRMLSVLDDQPPEIKDASPEIAQELIRLDSKLSLVLELVSEVLAHQLDVPEPTPVAVSEYGIEWQGTELPEVNRHVLVEVYLNVFFPRPLKVCAIVNAVTKQESGTAKILARFSGLSEDVRDGLAKLIFRHHRRLIASRRSV
ncbi:MAG: PilZ domain-containing protein [Gammaproteobacteria bacterium]